MLERSGLLPYLFLLLGIAVVAAFIVVIVKCILGARRWKQLDSAPTHTVEATILTKQRTEKSSNLPDLSGLPLPESESVVRCLVTFRCTDGEDRTLAIDEERYHLLMEGDIGTLTYQNDRILQFRRN